VEAGTIAQTERPTILLGTGIPAIPGYVIEREVARGGMGMILAARDPTLGRDVAIKVLLPERATEDAARRFVVESKVTARLPHPAIPPVYELGTLPDGNPFLVMKLILGQTFTDELKRADRVAEWPRFVQIFEQIAQAVGFAHSQGVVHRDLKPANVMVGAFGEVQVMDWGLAKLLANPECERQGEKNARLLPHSTQANEGYHTEIGDVMGTPSYMAPEQARGGVVGPPADVFALGGILCDILTGKPPFQGDTVRDPLRLACGGNVAVAFSRLDSCGLDAELIALCKRLLSPEVQARPADGKAVAEEVAAYRAGVEQRLRQAETERAAAEAKAAEEANTRREAEARSAEQRKRRRVQAVLTGAIVVIVGLLGLGAWWEDRQTKRRRLEQAEADARTVRSESARVAAEAEANTRTARSEAARANAEAEARRTVQGQMVELSGSSGLTAALSGDHPLALVWFAHAVQLASEHPKLDEINRIRMTNWLRQVWLPQGQFTIPEFQPIRDRCRVCQFSPDGNYLVAMTGTGTCSIWDCRKGRSIPLPKPTTASAVAWVPGEGLLAVADKTGTLQFLAPPSFQPAEKMEKVVTGDVSVLVFSRDGQYLAWGGAEGARVWSRKTNQYCGPLFKHPSPVVSVSFSASSRMIATAARDTKARVFQVETNQQDPVFPPVPHHWEDHGLAHGGADRVAPRFAGDDQVLLTRENVDSKQRLIWREAGTGRLLMTNETPTETTHLTAFSVSASGDQVVAVWEGKGRLWDARTRQLLANFSLGHRSAWCEDVLFTADGKTIITGAHSSGAEFWSVDDRPNGILGTAAPRIFQPQKIVRVDCSADGSHLAIAMWDGTVSLWHRPSGAPVSYRLRAGGVTLPVISPDGRFVLPGGTTYRHGAQVNTRVYHVETGKAASPVLQTQGLLLNAIFSPDGTWVATACSTARTEEERKGRLFVGDGKGGNVQIWDWKTGKRLQEPIATPTEPRGLAIHPNGKTLAVVCADYRVVLVDPDTGAITHHLDPGVRTRPYVANLWWGNGEARFSPDGRFLVTWELARPVHVWDAATKKLLHTLPHHERVESVAFSPTDPTVLATGGRDSSVRVWDLNTGKALAQLQHPAHTWRVKFHPNGRDLFTSCADGMFRVWDWQAGKLSDGFLPHTESLMDFTFPANRWLVTLGERTLLLMDWQTRSHLTPLLPLGKRLSLRLGLPAGEQQLFVGGFSGTLDAYDWQSLTTPIQGDPADLVRLAEVCAGRRIVNGQVVPLDSAEFAARWQHLQRGSSVRELVDPERVHGTLETPTK
jgi:WD40 repeat protein/tRNA A-37 threonylcarbamoyl transferase component Bud32